MTSLFRQITKYPHGDVDPRENRLTECLAAVLDRVDGLAAALVREVANIDVAPETKLWVRTQRLTAKGKFVDLELAFGAPVVPELRVWIEIKHGADLHENQLENYEEDLGAEAQERGLLVLLAPRGSMPVAAGFATAVEWQAVGRLMASWCTQPAVPPEHRWLLAEFVAYLREEGLVDEERLDAAHALGLAVIPAAERAIARLIEIAHPRVIEAWGQPGTFSGGKNPKFGTNWWVTFDPAGIGSDKAPGWQNIWFEWTLVLDEHRPEPRDSYAFFAGATFKNRKETILGSPNAGQWVAARANDGYELFEAWYWRLWRVLYPEQLLAQETLEEQATYLSEWIIDSFRTLAASPPTA